MNFKDLIDEYHSIKLIDKKYYMEIDSKPLDLLKGFPSGITSGIGVASAMTDHLTFGTIRPRQTGKTTELDALAEYCMFKLNYEDAVYKGRNHDDFYYLVDGDKAIMLVSDQGQNMYKNILQNFKTYNQPKIYSGMPFDHFIPPLTIIITST